MIRLSRAAAVVAAMVAVTQPALASTACVNSDEARAMQLRQLHIQLQVASLNCRADDPSLPGKYANYVNRFGGALSDNARVLRTHFNKSYGSSGGSQMDRYMTVLANDESQRAHQVDGYCESHAPLFEKISALKPHELERFAVETLNDPANPVCAKSTPPAVRSAAATQKSDTVKVAARVNDGKAAKPAKPVKATPAKADSKPKADAKPKTDSKN